MQISRTGTLGQKVIIRFWWESGLSSATRNHLTTFCTLFVHYACLRSCSAIVPFTETIVFVLSVKADQRNRWPQWLHFQFL